jgi:hypothetical protein
VIIDDSSLVPIMTLVTAMVVDSGVRERGLQ